MKEFFIFVLGNENKNQKEIAVVLSENNNVEGYRFQIYAFPFIDKAMGKIDIKYSLSVKYLENSPLKIDLDSELVNRAVREDDDIIANAVMANFDWFVLNFPLLGNVIKDKITLESQLSTEQGKPTPNSTKKFGP